MTLREINNAIKGFEKLRKDDFQQYMYGVRIQSYYAVAPYSKYQKYEDLFPLESDKYRLLEAMKDMKPIERTVIYHGQ